MVKYLIGQKADSLARNFKTQTPKMLAANLKDTELRTTMDALLDRTNMSTKVVRNTQVKEIKKQMKGQNDLEVERLRQQLKQALKTKGITDLAGVFKRFDTNGDGYFNEVEFGCAFTVLKVEFSKDDLRKLIRLTDTNNDGRISY